MSKLVQVWESSYTFTEDELGFFAQSQKDLSQPFTLPNVLTMSSDPKCSRPLMTSPAGWKMKLGAMYKNS
jgi:hypothetical protein